MITQDTGGAGLLRQGPVLQNLRGAVVPQAADVAAVRDDERVRISGRTFPAKNMAHALAVSKIGPRP